MSLTCGGTGRRGRPREGFGYCRSIVQEMFFCTRILVYCAKPAVGTPEKCVISCHFVSFAPASVAGSFNFLGTGATLGGFIPTSKKALPLN